MRFPVACRAIDRQHAAQLANSDVLTPLDAGADRDSKRRLTGVSPSSAIVVADPRELCLQPSAGLNEGDQPSRFSEHESTLTDSVTAANQSNFLSWRKCSEMRDEWA